MKVYNRILEQVSKHKFSFVVENRKTIGQFILAILVVALGIWFFRHEKSELSEVRHVLGSSNIPYLFLGIFFAALYISLQGLMYVWAFRTVQKKVTLYEAIILFLKRNFISIFMPAGGIASLAFFTGDIEKKGISKTKIYFASSIYAFFGILSVILVAIPIFLYTLTDGLSGPAEWISLAGMILMVSALYLGFRSIVGKGWVYRLAIRFFPSAEVFLEDLINHSIDSKFLILTVITSVFVDLIGIAHLYIAMLALNIHPSIVIAMLGYLTAVLSLMVSPFMRGLGTVEVSMAYILNRLGYTSTEALAITFLFRFFEFWLPLLSGAASFLLKINKLVMRLIPAGLILFLGIINIASALTPAVADRVKVLQAFLPLDAIAASNYFVLIAGAFMLLTATFLLRGLRSAWWIAITLSALSFVGHLTKAIDYEEATLALIIIAALFFSRKEYYVKSNPRLLFVGWQTALFSMLAVLIYGVVGFYYLDKNHFGIDFSLVQSIRYTFQNFFMVVSADLNAQSTFARNFLLSINISGFLSISFFLFTLLKPYVIKKYAEPDGLERAKALLEAYGKSALDHFKTYYDKMLFTPADVNAFISYRVSGSFAVVLENPVAENDDEMKKCIRLFDRYCYENGLKSIYYRVPEESLAIYKDVKKKSLFLGQEGIVDLTKFTLEGKSHKTLRNSVNKVIDKGYHCIVNNPPIKDGLLQKLKAVSDEWLVDTERKEIVFSQGMFAWDELKQQTIITIENAEEKIVGFLNIVPDFAPNEATYDLIRKTADAPGGVIDYMLIELFKYARSQGYEYLNVGFAPLSGLDVPQNLTEKSMKFAYNKINSFAQYRGLRDYKEKFSPVWTNKYLIYDHDFDLLQVPGVLSNVIKP